MVTYIKLIFRYIPNNDHPVKTLLTFCGVFHSNSPGIKGNPRGVLLFANINEMMWIQKQHSLKSGCLCKRIHPYIEAV